MHRLRLEQIQEALDDLEAVFSDPQCFHSEEDIQSTPWQKANALRTL